MVKTVILDTGVAGLITNPKRSESMVRCNQWLQHLVEAEIDVIVPEIVDYELRRELLRVRKEKGLSNLEQLVQSLTYLPIATEAMRQAAQCWAEARQQGRPTANDKNIDADMILVAQAMTVYGTSKAVIATTNVRHLEYFFPARIWPEITLDWLKD